ncbi:MAG: hydantoinase B/oxoprolinase family protein [Rhodothalassiaceae bacterium]
MSLNQIDAQIMWTRLLALVEEQAQTLIRTAFSTTVREAGDLSAGVFDTKGRMLAQAVTGTPGHVNAMAASVARFLAKYPLEALKPGDVLMTNDPWDGTGHLNDFTVVTPVFRERRAVALFASTTHIADVGGLGFGPEGRSVYEEGLLVPILPLFHQGQVNAVLMELIKANVRDPVAAEGDLYSLSTCNDTAGRRLLEMMTEFGLEDLDGLAGHVLQSSRAAMLEEIAALPPGRYENAMRIDGYDRPVDLVCAVSIGADGITIDWTGTSGPSGRGINVPMTYTAAYSSFGVRCVIGNQVPNNFASLDLIGTSAPDGCLLNAQHPAAVSARHAIGQMLPDVVLGALAEPLGGKVPAEGAACLWNPVLSGGPGAVGDHEGDPGLAFVINPFYTGGTGGRPGKPGLDCTAFPSGVRNTPVEINETTAPVIVWRKEFRDGSGGAGRWPGGLGQVMEFGHAEGKAFTVSRMFDRLKHPPRGRDGGGDGAAGKAYLSDGTVLSGMGRTVVPPGHSFIMETPGGGGLGEPQS